MGEIKTTKALFSRKTNGEIQNTVCLEDTEGFGSQLWPGILISRFQRGLECIIPPLKGSKGAVQNLREKSFQVHGAKLFNVLPKKIRNSKTNDVEEFKSLLDNFLQSIPDEPKVGEYVPSSCDQITLKPSNSLICQPQKTLRSRGF